MTDSTKRVAAVVEHFEQIEREHMRDLPILNPRLRVEAVGAQTFDEHQLFVLISPWFMNLVLLPGNDEWETSEQGASCKIAFPYSPLVFNVCHDAELGTYLTAALFRTVTDFPDRDSAIAVAKQVLRDLFTTPNAADTAANAAHRRTISRRSLLTGRGAN